MNDVYKKQRILDAMNNHKVGSEVFMQHIQVLEAFNKACAAEKGPTDATYITATQNYNTNGGD